MDSLAQREKLKFWHKIIQTFDLVHLSIPKIEGGHFLWRTREASHLELNYEEVRRLSLYNPTSYKKKLKIELPKNFALMKVVDENFVQIQNQTHHLELEFLPEGSLSLDFGVFSHDG